ncbi:MAG: hypothetical protein H7A33_01165 [Deltaproteobacteria bacterium]|nr:hypothetical protein [Deltaproteobacteria bacterium]
MIYFTLFQKGMTAPVNYPLLDAISDGADSSVPETLQERFQGLTLLPPDTYRLVSGNLRPARPVAQLVQSDWIKMVQHNSRGMNLGWNQHSLIRQAYSEAGNLIRKADTLIEENQRAPARIVLQQAENILIALQNKGIQAPLQLAKDFYSTKASLERVCGNHKNTINALEILLKLDEQSEGRDSDEFFRILYALAESYYTLGNFEKVIEKLMQINNILNSMRATHENLIVLDNPHVTRLLVQAYQGSKNYEACLDLLLKTIERAKQEKNPRWAFIAELQYNIAIYSQHPETDISFISIALRGAKAAARKAKEEPLDEYQINLIEEILELSSLPEIEQEVAENTNDQKQERAK